MRRVGQRAIVNSSDVVETQAQPTTEKREQAHTPHLDTFLQTCDQPSQRERTFVISALPLPSAFCACPNLLNLHKAHLFLRFQLRVYPL